MAALRFLLLTLLLGLAWPAQAMVVESIPERYNLLRNVEVFVDESRKVPSEEIIAYPERFDFKPTPSLASQLNFGFSDAVFWVKIPLSRAPQAPSDWILELPYLGLYEVCFYAPGKPVVTSGAVAPIESRPFKYRYFAFPLALSTTTEYFYLRVESNYAVTIPLVLYTLSAFNNEQVTDTLIQALYYGGLLSLLFYNLILFLTVRDRQYLIYCLFTGFTGLGVFAGNGYARLYLWPHAIEWDLISQNTLFGFAGIFAMAFTALYLRTRETQPKLNLFLKTMSGLYGLLALLFISTLFSNYLSRQWLFEIFFVVNFLASVTCLYSSVIAVKHGHLSAYYFSLAWGSLAVGSIIASLRVFELIPSNGFTLYALQIGSGLEMLLFSFALAYRIQHERLMRENIQAESLVAKQAALDAMKISEDRLEEAVEKRTEKLQQLLISERVIHDQYVRFGAMIAHEFRNPLNIIEGQTSMLELESESGINNTGKRTGAIRSATFRLANLFDQWMQSDRLNQQAGHLDLVQINLTEMLAELMRNSQSFHPEYVFEYEPTTGPVSIQADSHLLQIAVLNLIDNACKYSQPKTTIRLHLIGGIDRIGIRVIDQGTGIASSDLELIFEVYFRASRENQIKGTGLGLAFVKRIVELHNGDIEVQSKLGTGSTFTLWLPLPKSDSGTRI
jgi:signal transduction histidine kinase